MSGAGRDEFERHAFEVPFDPDNDPNCGLTKENTQEVIEELCKKVNVSASPGFSWGKGGSAGPGEYLYNEEVESNKQGRIVPFDGNVVRFFCGNRKNIGTRTMLLRRRRPCQTGSWVTIATLAFSAGEYCKSIEIKEAVLDGDELSVRVASGSNDFEDPIVSIIVKN